MQEDISLWLQVSRTLEDFDVEERPMSQLQAQCPNVTVIQNTVSRLDSQKQVYSVDCFSLTFF